MVVMLVVPDPRRCPRLLAAVSFVFALASCAGSTAPRASEPCAEIHQATGVVCRFYQAHLEIRPIGLPTPAQQRVLAPYLTPALMGRIDDARRYQEEFEAEHPDEKPPFVDGSLFTSMYEGFDRFEIVRSEPDASGGAKVIVRFEYKDAPPWEDAVIVTREGDRYAIDDMVFSGAGAFNPAHRLTEALSWRE